MSRIWEDRDRSRQLSMLGAAFLLIATLGVLYAESFKWLATIWFHEKEYSHGFLVPLVSAYFIYLHRRLFTACSPRPALFSGMFFILVAALLLIIGRLFLIIQFEVLSFFILLPGIILFLLGWNFFILLLIPLAYLLFMLPVMDYLPGDIHVPLQRLAAAGGAGLMQLDGYAVYREGVLLHLPEMTIRVARVCSGVNLLFSVLAVGIPLVYLYQRSLGKALLVLAGGVLIAIGANSVRVALAGITAMQFGINMLHGPHHVLQAFSVAVVGYIALFLLNYLVNRYSPGSGPLLYEQVSQKFQSLELENRPAKSSFFRALVSLFMVLFIIALVVNVLLSPKNVPLRRSLSYFPARIGGWAWTTCKTKNKDLGAKVFPGIPVKLERSYTNGDGGKVDCFIGYFPRQDVNRHVFTFHSSVLRSETEPVNLASSCTGNPETVNHGLVSLDNGRRVEAVLWYLVAGKSEVDPGRVRLAYAKSTLLRQRNDIAVILLTHNPGMGRSAGDMSMELRDFLSVFPCKLRDFIP